MYPGWLENSFVVAHETRIRAASNKLLCPVILDHAISLCSVLCKGQAVSYQVMVFYSGCWTAGREVWDQDLAGSMCYFLGQNTLLSQCLSPPRNINGYRKIVRVTC